MKKKNDYTLLIIICVILLCILGIMYLNKKDNKVIDNKEPNYVLVKDYSKFFTINSCVYKYINFLSSNKSDDVLNVLDQEYIKQNNITLDNVFNYVNKLEGIYTFKSKKIYYEFDNSNRYYIYGNLIEEQMDGNGNIQDYYLIVNIDNKNNLFSVTPYDGAIFKEDK